MVHRFSFFCLGATLLSDDIQQAGQGIARRKNPSPLSAFVLGPILHLVCPQFCCFSRAFVGLATAGESASSSLLRRQNPNRPCSSSLHAQFQMHPISQSPHASFIPAFMQYPPLPSPSPLHCFKAHLAPGLGFPKDSRSPFAPNPILMLLFPRQRLLSSPSIVSANLFLPPTNQTPQYSSISACIIDIPTVPIAT